MSGVLVAEPVSCLDDRLGVVSFARASPSGLSGSASGCGAPDWAASVIKDYGAAKPLFLMGIQIHPPPQLQLIQSNR